MTILLIHTKAATHTSITRHSYIILPENLYLKNKHWPRSSHSLPVASQTDLTAYLRSGKHLEICLRLDT